MHSRYCIPKNSTEIIIVPKLIFDTYKYYFIFGLFTLGSLADVIYMSPYLFDILEKSNFNKTKFLNNIDNTQIKKEINSLFKSEVIINKRNPTIPEIMEYTNNLFKNGRRGALTFGIMETIPINLIDHVNINNKIYNKQEVINKLVQHNIKYYFKDWEVDGGYKYRKYKHKYLKLKNSLK